MSRQSEESQRRWERWQRSRSDRDRAALIESLYPLIAITLQRLRHTIPPYVDREDLSGALVPVLIRAAERYDRARGKSISPWVILKLRGAIRDYCRMGGGAHDMTRRISDLGLACDRAEERLTVRLGRQPTLDEIAAEMDTDPDRLRTVLDERHRLLFQHDIQFYWRAESEVEMEDAYEEHAGLRVPGPEPGDLLLTWVREWTEGGWHARHREMVRRVLLSDETRKEAGSAYGVSESRSHQLYQLALSKLREHLAEVHGITAETW